MHRRPNMKNEIFQEYLLDIKSIKVYNLSMSTINEIINDLNEKYIQVISRIEPGYTHNEQDYKIISEILNFILSSNKVSKSHTDQALLTFGKTGWGKSTSINYLNGARLVVTERGGLAPLDADQTLTSIGNGNGSTTLYPEFCETCFGKVYDLPGDEETRGIVPEIINCVSKKSMGKILKKIKILLVMPASTFTYEGSYGRGLKDILAANDKFLMDINKYKDNIIFLITSVNRKQKEPELVKQNILKCLEHKDKALEKYKELFEHVFKHNRIRMIPKPSENDEEGDPFTVPTFPTWAFHQREEIVKEIQSLPNRLCGEEDFSVPYNPKIIEDLSKILLVLIEKVKSQIEKKLTRLTLSGVQLKFAHSLLNKLRTNQKRTLKQFQEIFTSNEYFEFPELSQVQRCLELISEFLHSDNRQNEYSENWVTSNLESKIAHLAEKVERLILEKGGDFRKQLNSEELLVRGNSSKFAEIKHLTNELKNNYNIFSKNQLKKQNQESQFYTTYQQKVFDKTIQEPYNDTENYVQYESRTKTVKVPRQTTQMRSVEKTRIVFKTQKQMYTQLVPKTRKITKYKTFTVTRSTSLFGLFPLGSSSHDEHVPYEVDQVYYEPQERQRDVQVPVTETYREKEPFQKVVYEDQTVTEKVPVSKSRTVTKYREKQNYKDQPMRKFDKNLYDTAQNKVKKDIENLRKKIMEIIESDGKSELKHAPKLFEAKEEIEKKYLDLLNSWCENEHRAFERNNLHKSLREEIFEEMK